jgi:hypothetical protein
MIMLEKKSYCGQHSSRGEPGKFSEGDYFCQGCPQDKADSGEGKKKARRGVAQLPERRVFDGKNNFFPRGEKRKADEKRCISVSE